MLPTTKKFLLCACIALLPNWLQAEPIQVETLLKSNKSWDDAIFSYPQGEAELSVLKIVIPAHTILPWHTHPMPNAAYVLSGSLTVEKKETGEKKTLTQGQVLPELVSSSHRGYTGDKPVELIVFYAGIKDMPLSNNDIENKTPLAAPSH